MKTQYALIISILLTSVLSCKKVEVDTQTYGVTINAVNALAASNNDLKVNFTGGEFPDRYIPTFDFYRYDGFFSNGLFVYAVPSDKPVPLKIVWANDPSKVVFEREFQASSGSIHSLWIIGTDDKQEAIFIEEKFPERKDSTIGIRFMNLSPDAGAVSFNIAGEPAGSAVASLPYKGMTGFIPFPSRAVNEFYVFEVRDAITGDFITDLYFDVARMKNETVMLRGLRNGGYPDITLSRIRH